MPSRWFVPLEGIDPTRVCLEQIHAAVSGWFDAGPIEHGANDKPYAVSPLTRDERSIGLEVATLTEEAEVALLGRIGSGAPIRLGSQVRPMGRPRLMHEHTWEELAGIGTPGAPGRWVFDLVTPTTFRSGDRSSPLPHVPTMVGGLLRAWETWSDLPRRCLTSAQLASLWVSDIDLRSEVLRLRVRRRRGPGTQIIHVSAATGSLILRCDDPEAMALLAPLLGLAAYCGVGSMRGKGLGVVRVRRIAGNGVTRGEVMGRGEAC